MENYTLKYYNEKAKSFHEDTVDADMSEAYERFLPNIYEGGHILDFGCGSGRDAKYFVDEGYQVTATDGSEAMCIEASKYTGIEVEQLLFHELAAVELYDGIWACSSILHLNKSELTEVLKKIGDALAPGGVFYTSFKYGNFEGERNGRYFTNLTENTFQQLLNEAGGMEVIEEWISNDVRAGREDEKWLNVICRKL